jgi:hypothetical protein
MGTTSPASFQQKRQPLFTEYFSFRHGFARGIDDRSQEGGFPWLPTGHPGMQWESTRHGEKVALKLPKKAWKETVGHKNLKKSTASEKVTQR